MLADLVRGAGYVWRGLRIVFRPGLRRFAVAPVLVSVVVFAAVVVIAMRGFDVLVEHLLPAADVWWQAVLHALMWVFFALTTVLVVYFCFTIVANLIAAPFNGWLAEAVERQLTGIGDSRAPGLARLLKDMPRALLNELRKFLYYLTRLLPVLILFWLPGAQILAPLVWVLVISWLLAVEYVDYPMSNRGHLLKDVRRYLADRRMLSLGFGAMTLALTLVPVVNLVIMPAAVAGATALWLEERNHPRAR